MTGPRRRHESAQAHNDSDEIDNIGPARYVRTRSLEESTQVNRIIKWRGDILERRMHAIIFGNLD